MLVSLKSLKRQLKKLGLNLLALLVKSTCSGVIQCKQRIKTLLRLYQGYMKALLRLY